MPNEDKAAGAKLLGIVRRLTQDVAWQKELLDEALVHWWRKEVEEPGKTVSWYLTSCEYHLRDYLRGGRSLDSPKRRSQGCLIDVLLGGGGGLVPGWAVAEGNPLQAASFRDWKAKLGETVRVIDRKVLALLAEDWTVPEIAEKVGVSEMTVRNRRRQIAAAARKIGVDGP